MGEQAQLRLTYFDQRDIEVDQTHFVVEVVKKLTPWLSGSIYGEPSHFKRQNDFGLALLFYPAETHEIRVFHTWVDFTRNQHNDRQDTYKEEKDPRSMGIVGRCSGCFGKESDFLEYYLRYETPTTWRFPQTLSEYGYENRVLGTKLRFSPVNNENYLNFKFQISRKFEGTTGFAGSTVASDSRDRRLLELETSYDIGAGELFGQALRVSPGVGWFHRHWRDNTNAFLEHRNAVASLWAERGEIGIGYMGTWFSSNGNATYRPPELKHYVVEHRLNLRYIVNLSEDSELSLMGTADADDGGTFEGGQGMLKANF